MKNKTKLFLIAILMASSFELSAQNTPLTSGGEATGSGGTVSYSIGQVFYSIASSTEGSMNAGVQQSYVISTSMDETSNEIQLSLLAFPNPTRDYLNLKIEGERIPGLLYRILDMSGQEIDAGQALNGTVINVQDFASSTYFLQIIDSKKTIKSFRIIKN
jgi:hypothetical protein